MPTKPTKLSKPSASKTRKRSSSKGASRRRRSHDGPHWHVMLIPGHQEDGSDTWWHLVYGQMKRSEEVGRGDASMRRAGLEANRRNEAARDRMRRARRA